jgi:6-pyruvoyl-tetrahydropterin synthase related domain
LYVSLAAAAVVAPMLWRGNISGHDFRFHVESWMDVQGQWRERVLFPRWAEWANWGFGEPRFIFYPPLSWVVGAALGSALPWKMVPAVFIWIVLVVAGLSMWRLARESIPGPWASLAAVLYAINPYHLVIVYYRSAFAELLAAAFLPLLIWAALRVVEAGWREVPTLALVFACVWLSNAPAAVIATYSLGIVLLAGCLLSHRLRPLPAGLAAIAGGFALACFYILPAAWEERWVQIKQIVSDAYRPSVNFLFTRANDPDFVAFNWKVSWVASGLIAAGVAGALVALRRREETSRARWILAVLGLVATALMLSPSLWLWRHLPELWFIQFPWRWLDVAGIAFAFLVAAAIAKLASRALQRAVMILVLLAIAGAAAAMLRQAPWDGGDVAQIATWIHEGRGYEGTDEYAPAGCDRYQLPGDPDDSERPADVSPDPAPEIAKLDPDSAQIVRPAGVGFGIETWESTDRRFTVETSQPVTIAPRLLEYPAWNVQVNGRPAKFGVLPETDQVLLPLDRGTSHVQIRFRETGDRLLGDAVSLVAAIVLGPGVWAYRRRWPVPCAR